MNDKIKILIPAYEPTESFIELLKKLNKEKLTTIVVNDGSNNTYDKIFKKAKEYATVLEYETNKGKGFALKTGIKYIYDNYNEDFIIVTMDCDGQHTIKDALKLANYTLENQEHLVLGKRIRSEKTPIKSKIGNSITRFLYRTITGLDVYDTQTGLRAFSNKLVPLMLEIEGNRFEYEMNVLLKCCQEKIIIKELEIETIYIDNNSNSHFDAIKDSIRIYKEIFKFLTSSLISFIIDYILYTILIITTNRLIISNIIARIISSTINYNINKKLVFKSNLKGLKPLIKYFTLVIIILVLNNVILNLLVNNLMLNEYISKLITELVLVTMSWKVQKKLVF